jgi:hypothetical protein
MSQFLTALDVIQIEDASHEGRGTWITQAPLVYQSDSIGDIVVPVGFSTDFASVPRIPVLFDIAGDRGNSAGTVHDFLYDVKCTLPVSRKQADAVLMEALISQGVAKWIAFGMYLAVRVFASSHYRK